MKRCRFVILLLLFSSLAFAQKDKKALPKDMPAYGPLKPMEAPRTTPVKLDNGLTVWLVPEPGFPKVALVVAVRGGYAGDPKDKPGVSELLLAAIDQGTKTRTARQIAEEIQAAGGDLTGAAEQDDVHLSTSVLASKVEAGLTVLADVVQNATFPDDEVALAKRNLGDSLRSREAEPSFLANRALAQVLFGDHPYSVTSPTQESIASTTAADLRQDFARRFRPNRSLLVVVGDFDPARIEAAVRNLFGRWTATGQAAAVEVPKPTGTPPHTVFLVPRQGSVQTTLALGGFGPARRDADYEPAQVANAIYGGMFGSRLINNIREDKGYTYSPGSGLRPYREAGMIGTRADVRNPVTGASFNEINYELNRMVTTSPSEEELARAKRYLVGTLAISLQSRESVGRALATLWVDGLPPEELGMYSQKIERVSDKDVDAAARKYFPASRMTIVAVGEEKVVRDELAPFGLEIKLAPQPGGAAQPGPAK